MKSVFVTIVLISAITLVENADSGDRLFNVNRNKDCTVSGKNGTCVPAFQCDDNMVIRTEPKVDQSELRAGSTECEINEFCCLAPNNQTEATTHNSKPENTTPCPWCAQLIVRGDSEYPIRSATGVYCAGILVQPRLVLTTAGCILAAGRRAIQVTFPSNKNTGTYTTDKIVKHNKYNSGTREFDFAIIRLDRDVTGVELAPILFNISLSGICHGVGYDSQDKIVLTKLSVEEGRCNQETAIDTSCGHTDANCNVMYGAPVLCTRDNDVIIPGMVRDKCQNGLTSMGGFKNKLVASWILSQIKLLQN